MSENRKRDRNELFIFFFRRCLRIDIFQEQRLSSELAPGPFSGSHHIRMKIRRAAYVLHRDNLSVSMQCTSNICRYFCLFRSDLRRLSPRERESCLLLIQLIESLTNRRGNAALSSYLFRAGRCIIVGIEPVMCPLSGALSLSNLIVFHLVRSSVLPVDFSHMCGHARERE